MINYNKRWFNDTTFDITNYSSTRRTPFFEHRGWWSTESAVKNVVLLHFASFVWQLQIAEGVDLRHYLITTHTRYCYCGRYQRKDNRSHFLHTLYLISVHPQRIIPRLIIIAQIHASSSRNKVFDLLSTNKVQRFETGNRIDVKLRSESNIVWNEKRKGGQDK